VKNITHPIYKLIAEGEHQQLDFKFEISDARKIAKTFSAFANTDGGTLLVGVKDNGKIAGVRSDEEYYMLDSAASLYCKPKVPFDIRRWNVDGKTVLEVIIPPAEIPPHYAEVEPGKALAFVRVKDENFLAPSVLLKVWRKQRSRHGAIIQIGDREKQLLEYLDTNPSISLTKAVKIVRMTRFQTEHILSDLIVMDVIELYFEGDKFFFRKKQA
jgi:predicted HTH transcriptional regulator